MDEKKNEQNQIFKSRIKLLLDSIRTDSNSIIESIIVRFESLIALCIRDLPKISNGKLDMEDLFSEDDIKELAYSCTLHYLVGWLRNDKKQKQTITSFQKQPFVLKGEHITEGINQSIKGKYEEYYDIQKKLYDNFALRKKQIKDTVGDTKRNDGTGKDFIELAFLDMQYRRYIDIYNDLWYYKGVLQRSRTSRANDSLPEAYERLNKMLDDMKKFKDRKFVAYCFQLFELESSYHFFFVPKIAKYMQKNKLSLTTSIPYIINAICADDTDKKTKQRVPMYYFCDQKELIEYDFTTKEFIDSKITKNNDESLKKKIEEYQLRIHKILKWKEIEHYVTLMYCDAYPFSKQPDWDSELFKEVKLFLIDTYEFSKRFPKIDLDDPVEPRNMYDYIRKIYQSPFVVNQDALSLGRKYLQDIRFKRNKTKKTHFINKDKQKDPI